MAADRSDTTTRTDRTTRRWTDRPTALTAVAVGAVLAFIGIAAPLVEGASGAFLGLGRNYLHDFVHIGSGLAGLAAGLYAGGRFGREYDLAMGATYGLVTLLGIVAFDLMADLIALNAADNAFHFALTVVLLGVGYYYGRRDRGG